VLSRRVRDAGRSQQRRWFVTSQVGPTTDDLTIVTSGHDESDRAVTDGQYRLQVDAAVIINPATALGLVVFRKLF
jgi:hypothetical protein